MLMVVENPNKVRIGKPVPDDWITLPWYVATCKPGQDHAARDELEAVGVPVFMMEGRDCPKRRHGKRALVDYPVFRGYLFVADVPGSMMAMTGKHVETRWQHAGGNDWHVVGERLTDNPNTAITGFIGKGRAAERVNGAVMQLLFALHEAAEFAHKSERDALRARIRKDDIVQITAGSFEWFTGVVQSFHSRDHVEILAQIFGRETRVTVPLDSLERIEA